MDARSAKASWGRRRHGVCLWADEEEFNSAGRRRGLGDYLTLCGRTRYIAAIAGSLAAKDCDGSDGNESDHGAGGVCDGAERDCDGSRGVHSGAVEEPVDGEGDLAAEEGR